MVLHFRQLSSGPQTPEALARYRNADLGPATSPAFAVPTPYHEALWFRMLLLAAVALLGGLAYSARITVLNGKVTELKGLVRERTQRLAEAVQKSERQVSLFRRHDVLKTRFFTNISHEFRTPLTLIGGTVVDLIQGRKGALAEGVGVSLGIVSDNTDRLTRLVEDLLEMSSLEAGEALLRPGPGDLAAGVRGIVRAHEPVAERAGVRLTSSFAVRSYPAVFDAGAIDMVVANLISNAVKHTPRDGHVLVRFSADEGESGVSISVRDDGEGIPEDLLPHIFDRFVLGEEGVGSSGIGLALVREVVAFLQGTIEVESEVGRGSCFTVTLPLARQNGAGDGYASVAPSLHLARQRPAEPLAGETDAKLADAEVVLVVDDNADVRSYVASHLADRYRTCEASGGAEALALAKEHGPSLIISDVLMPGMSGEELCRQLRADEALAHIPVILLTARAGGQAAADGLRSGADAYVEKPFHIDALLARVEGLLAIRKMLQACYGQSMVVEGLGVEVNSADEALTKQLFEVVDAHIGECTFGVGELAVELGLSPRHLRRRIKEATGESPAALLRRYRLEVAARLLAAGAVSVCEAGYRVGYASPAAFGTQFKKHFGVCPSEYAAAPPEADGS